MEEIPEVEDATALAVRAAREQLIYYQRVFAVTCVRSTATVAQKQELLSEAVTKLMGFAYESLCSTLGLPLDAGVLARLRAENAAEVSRLDSVIADAKENHGVVELGAAVMKKAQYLGSVGDKEGALKAYTEVPDKALSTGGKADIAMACARLAFISGDKKLMVERLAEAKQLNDKGGDWDRRNRLKVYDGLLAIVQRDFKKASASLLDSVSTFTALELLTFDHFLFYTVLVALKTLERPALKKKVIDSPDVIAALTGEPLLATLAHSFYEGRYADFLGALVELHPRLLADRYFAPHAPWYMREMRVAAYVQFLESYKSVTLAGMAAVFGVTVPFLDKELELLIAAGRVGAKIDAQTGIIQSSRPDTKNAQYNEVIKQGDALLNKVQRLARIISS